MRKKTKNEYERERDKWYAKLKKDGFKDIEHSEDILTEYSTVFFKNHTVEEIEAKQRYHDMANAFLEHYKFENKRDRIIWEYHTNGISARDIASLLKKVKIKTNRTTISQTILRLKVKMFDLLWAPLKEYHE